MWSNRREMKYFKFHTISKSETTLIDKIMDTYKNIRISINSNETNSCCSSFCNTTAAIVLLEHDYILSKLCLLFISFSARIQTKC